MVGAGCRIEVRWVDAARLMWGRVEVCVDVAGNSPCLLFPEPLFTHAAAMFSL